MAPHLQSPPLRGSQCSPCWHVLKKIAFWGVWRMVLPSEFMTITFTSNAATPSCLPRHGKPTWTTKRKREAVNLDNWFRLHRNHRETKKKQRGARFCDFHVSPWELRRYFDYLGNPRWNSCTMLHKCRTGKILLKKLIFLRQVLDLYILGLVILACGLF